MKTMINIYTLKRNMHFKRLIDMFNFGYKLIDSSIYFYEKEENGSFTKLTGTKTYPVTSQNIHFTTTSYELLLNTADLSFQAERDIEIEGICFVSKNGKVIRKFPFTNGRRAVTKGDYVNLSLN